MAVVEGDGFLELENGFLTESGQPCEPILINRLDERGDGAHAQFLIQQGDFLGAEPLDVEKFENSLGKLGAKFAVKFQFIRGRHFHEFVSQGIANSLDASEVIGRSLGDDVSGIRDNSFRSRPVGADFEGIFSLEFQ